MTGRATAVRAGSSSAVAVAVAGSATIATAFGMARYGYGLLLPDIQDDLGLGLRTLGAIGTLAYASYLAATAVVTRSVEVLGGRTTVIIGGLLAVVGTVLVSMARGPVVLGTGVCVAGASAGLSLAPFGDAVRRLPPVVRARTMAVVSCGTGWGVAFAAPIAILTGDAWRIAYLAFAACAVLSTVLASRALPGPAAHRPAPRAAEARRPRRRGSARLVVSGLVIGLGSATFWTFAVDHVHDAGIDETTGRVLLGVAGIASLAGLATGDVIARLGARFTFVLSGLAGAAALAILALFPAHVAAVLVAAGLFGAAYNTIVTTVVLWATRIHRDRPSAGVAAATSAQGLGLLGGPLAGGLFGQAASLGAVLLGGAALLAVATLLAPRRDLIRDAEPQRLEGQESRRP